MPSHNILTDPNLHEPKGVASAAEAKVYVSDGAGSGAWTYLPTGFVRYQHDGADQVVDTTPSKLVCDGTGSNSTELYLPRVIRGTGASLWDKVTNDITPIAEGDAYTMRLDLPYTAKTGSPTILTCVLDIGSTGGITIPIITRDISLVKNPPYSISVTTNFDCLDTFFANGGQWFLSVDTGDITISGATVQITRTHGEM